MEIVDKVVNENKLNYANEKIKFLCTDVISEELPNNYDLIIVRDFLIHINNKEVFKLLSKLKKLNSKFIAINTFPKVKNNIDIGSFGQHRDINFEIEPFNLKNMFISIPDYDRRLNIYKIDQIDEKSHYL